MNWAEEEFKTREFGAARLDRRAVLLAEQLSQRMRSHPVVLCLQDTTELDFRGQDIEGLGPLSYEAQRGLYPPPPPPAPPGGGAVGANQFGDRGARFQARGRRSAPGNAGERALARRL